MSYLFTSESVSEGHPDKIADQISDAILDNFLAFDPHAKVACETLVTTGQVILSGEVKSKTYVDVQRVARDVIKKIGYTNSEYKFDYKSCGILSMIHEQSEDINRGVVKRNNEDQGAGDQGIMFGYATNETKNYMPLALDISNKILQEFNFPKNIIFSHPVAGSHLSGEKNSVADLFNGKSTILSYHDSVASQHVDRVRNLWNALGSNITVLDAELHDKIFAYSSHLPHVAAYALLNTLKGLDQDDLSDFSGGGLGEFLRLVSSSPEMWTDIFSMNKKNIALAIDDLMKSLSILKDKIGNDPKSLQTFLGELKDFKESNY